MNCQAQLAQVLGLNFARGLVETLFYDREATVSFKASMVGFCRTSSWTCRCMRSGSNLADQARLSTSKQSSHLGSRSVPEPRYYSTRLCRSSRRLAENGKSAFNLANSTFLLLVFHFAKNRSEVVDILRRYSYLKRQQTVQQAATPDTALMGTQGANI